MIKAGRDLQRLYLLKALAKKQSNQILVRFLDDEKIVQTKMSRSKHKCIDCTFEKFLGSGNCIEIRN